jgi:tetratricopeptide (TPR) repeat protein
MSNKTHSPESKAPAENELEHNVGEFFSKSEQFIENNKNVITGVIVALVLVVGGYLGIRHLYLIPREKEAQNAIFRGQNYFMQEQWDKALYGDSAQYTGFEAIADEYSLTRTGALAKAYAGICYYYKGDYENAIKYLKKFSAGDNMIDPSITGLIGDCYVDMDQVENGIDFFLKAASGADDPMLSPIYLKKAGRAYEHLKNYREAVKAYSAIKEKYPTSLDAQDIDKYIDRAQAKI